MTCISAGQRFDGRRAGLEAAGAEKHPARSSINRHMSRRGAMFDFRERRSPGAPWWRSCSPRRGAGRGRRQVAGRARRPSPVRASTSRVRGGRARLAQALPSRHHRGNQIDAVKRAGGEHPGDVHEGAAGQRVSAGGVQELDSFVAPERLEPQQPPGEHG